ncbi:MAG: glycosyltransferase family 9 protein [Gemmatimonadota bacterium]
MRTAYRRLACRLLRVMGRRVRPSPYRGGEIETAVVLIPELFGDTILTTPLLRALRSVSPSIDITVIGNGPGVSLLAHDGAVSAAVDLRRATPGERSNVFRRRFDVLLSTKDHPSFTNLRLVRRIDAAYRIGFDHPGHHGFFDSLVERPENMPVWEKTTALVEPLRRASSPAPRPYLPDGPISTAVREFVTTHLAERSAIAVNISASKPEKRWPTDRWKNLLEAIARPVVVLSAPEHSADRSRLEAALPSVVPSPATESLFDVGHIVRHTTALLSTDTAVVHIASCFDTPVVALYRNPRDLAKFPPLSSHNQVLLALDDDLSSIGLEQVREGLEELERELA